MRFLFLTAIVSLLLFGTAAAQNIVPNPGFVAYDTCPNSFSQIARCTGWRSANKGTPDYYNSCVSSAVGVPVNINGYQASSDNAYAGVYSFAQGGGQPEYITIGIPALQIGITYTVKINVSLADSATYGCDGLGVFFYINRRPDTASVALIPFTPQVDYSSLGAITDKSNWVTLSKTFVADSAYTHIVIGSFKAEAALTKVLDTAKAAHTIYTPFAYYFIDSVIIAPPFNLDVSDAAPQLNAAIYPNPFAGSCTVWLGSAYSLPCELSIYNIQGSLVRKVSNITGRQTVIEQEGLQTGIYYYQLRNASDVIHTGKLVVY
jgi:hypothetical protein